MSAMRFFFVSWFHPFFLSIWLCFSFLFPSVLLAGALSVTFLIRLILTDRVL